MLFPVLIYFAVTVPITLSASGELVIPVAVYMSIIGLMIWRAAVIAVDESASGIKRWAALIGAVLFAFSDTLIGINKFVTPLPGGSYAIILLYWGGQALIAAAAVARTSQSFTPNT
ncbi:MAG: lysoplasmalogenase [Rhodocyclaceae bacterium]|nr:lysoplasmalogenase [Rhodocyclaceae bacterium]